MRIEISNYLRESLKDAGLKVTTKPGCKFLLLFLVSSSFSLLAS